MIVLSLFDGISGAQVALEKAGIAVSKYYASEFDKYPIQITQHNYPSTVQLGDITKWQSWDIDWSKIDLLVGGSPCQGFSFAGKQLAFDDPRSKLFFVYVDILNHIKKHNPEIRFLLENVKMKKEFLDVISDQLGVEPVFINSALVSAQNRQRYYWCNWTIEQPADKEVVLADVIEGGEVDRSKAHCIDANYFKGGNLKSYFEKNRRQLVFASCIGRNPRIVKMFQNGEKSNTLTANYFKGLDADSRPGIAYADSLGDKYRDAVNKGFRKLTPLECERLQTFQANYTLVTDKNGKQLVSNTQRYKALGNSFTTDVIAHIFKQIPGA